jgi:hypothetical protein
MIMGTNKARNKAKMSIKNNKVIEALIGADNLFLPIFILARKFITGEPSRDTTQASKIQMRISLK